MSINSSKFSSLAQAQQRLSNMPEGQSYAIQYRLNGESKFSEIDPSPSDIYTIERAERLFSIDNGKTGTEVRLVKVSRYLTTDGKLAIQSVVRYRIVR